MNCVKCGLKPATVSAVLEGEYYRFLCEDCRPQPKVNSGHARWERSIDLEDHLIDIMQPFNADGSRNADFIKVYPKQAAAIFTKEQMDDTLRR